MVSNTVREYKDLSSATYKSQSMDKCENVKKEMPETLSRSKSQRKDTKDSGYGGYSSECEEDFQHLPDWCRLCIKGENAFSKSENAMNRNDSETKDDVDHEEDDRDIVLSFDNNSKMIAHDDENRIVSEGEFCRFKENDDRNLWGTNDAGNIQICKNKGNNSKPHQRHRRITPIPLSNPLKLTFRSSPDCLFVEEEDTEDIQIFNLEDEFVDQGLLQLTSSPKGSPRLARKQFENNRKTELQRMEAGEDTNQKPRNAFSRCLSEVADPKKSPSTARRHRQELLGRRIDFLSEDENCVGTTMQLPRLYMRSKSENDSCTTVKGGLPRGDWPPQVSSLARSEQTVVNSNIKEGEEVDKKNATEDIREGEDSIMSSKDIPQIELEPTASLPDWMKEANATETVSAESKKMIKDIEEPSIKNQEQVSVRMRKDESQARKFYPDLKDPPEVNEDVVKIYIPQKHYEGKKPRRSRKLTPARATSPSLEKLADLQDQIFAFSLAEQDSD